MLDEKLNRPTCDKAEFFFIFVKNKKIKLACTFEKPEVNVKSLQGDYFYFTLNLHWLNLIKKKTCCSIFVLLVALNNDIWFNIFRGKKWYSLLWFYLVPMVKTFFLYTKFKNENKCKINWGNIFVWTVECVLIVGLDQNILLFVRWVGIRCYILRFEYPSFFHFFLTPGIPAKWFSFAFEYESPMSEHHDYFLLEEKTKMPKTSAVWEHFKLSEDKTKAVCQICDLKLAYHNSTSSLKNHPSSASSTPIVYCWCKKASCF